MIADKILFFRGKLFGFFKGQFQETVGEPAIGILLDLLKEGRNDVEGLSDIRKLIEDERHVKVILAAVQTHPGQLCLPCQEVLIIRLVHMEDKGEMNHKSSLQLTDDS